MFALILVILFLIFLPQIIGFLLLAMIGIVAIISAIPVFLWVVFGLCVAVYAYIEYKKAPKTISVKQYYANIESAEQDKARWAKERQNYFTSWNK